MWKGRDKDERAETKMTSSTDHFKDTVICTVCSFVHFVSKIAHEPLDTSVNLKMVGTVN